MRCFTLASLVLGLAACLLTPSRANAQTPMPTAFTYQGRLLINGSPYSGPASVEVSLWDALSGGNQIFIPGTYDAIVTHGEFTILPDFGADAFNGQARWIELKVTTPGQPVPITLSPRQAVIPTPYALQTRGIFVNIDQSVGIGTVTPAAALDVVGNSWFPHLRVAARDDATTPFGAFFSLDASPITGGKNWLIYSTGSNAGEGAGKLIIRNYTNNAQGVAIDADGNVGIGTYSPTQAKLDVVGSTTGIRVTAPDYGVYATTTSDGIAINAQGQAAPAVLGTSTSAPGVKGVSSLGNGIEGISLNSQVWTPGVFGSGPYGVKGESTALTLGRGVYGVADRGNGTGVYGYASGGGNSIGVYGEGFGTQSKAAVFQGKVDVVGTLTKSGGSFRIDHPLDPANKFLSHSFVESPDMMNVYNGNVTTDGAGYATITMPEWFQALNRDFRYQLTVIDTTDSNDFTQAKIVRPIAGNQFTLRTSRPGTTVSWQVTGIRHDPWANANRIPVEQAKAKHEQGRYLTPREYGMPEELGMEYERSNAAREARQK